jgi:hypothetical protein
VAFRALHDNQKEKWKCVTRIETSGGFHQPKQIRGDALSDEILIKPTFLYFLGASAPLTAT